MGWGQAELKMNLERTRQVLCVAIRLFRLPRQMRVGVGREPVLGSSQSLSSSAQPSGEIH